MTLIDKLDKGKVFEAAAMITVAGLSRSPDWSLAVSSRKNSVGEGLIFQVKATRGLPDDPDYREAISDGGSFLEALTGFLEVFHTVMLSGPK